MYQIIQLMAILMPLFIGFSICLKNQVYIKICNKLLTIIVYCILWITGISLSRFKEINIGEIFSYAVVFLFFTITINAIVMFFFDRYRPWKHYQPQSTESSAWRAFLGSLKMPAVIVLGFMCDRVFPPIPIHDDTTSYLLKCLLFLVGIQLRSNGISLRTVLINRRGVQMAVLFVFATWIGGVIAGLCLGVPITKSLALSSGFGWYSLSGGIITNAYGAFWGTIALLNDLSREIVALIFIPIMMRYSSSMAITTGGATALDYTLPVIHQSGGISAIPLAVSYSFIVNLIAPIAMLFFSGLG